MADDNMTPEAIELNKKPEIGTIVRVESLPAFIDVPTFHRIERIPQDYINSYLAASLVGEFNPFIEPEVGYKVSTREADFLGKTNNAEEVVDAIGEMGDKQYQAWKALYGEDWVSRARSVIKSGQISDFGPQREIDIEILKEVDIALGNRSRRLNASLTSEGVEFREETYRIIEKGDINYTPKGELIERTLVLPKDTRNVGIVRKRLTEILPRLSFSKRSGYELMAHAFEKFGDAAVRTGLTPLVFSI